MFGVVLAKPDASAFLAMRKALSRAIAFGIGAAIVAGVLVTVTGLPYTQSLESRLTWSFVLGILPIGLVCAPGSWVAFARMRKWSVSHFSAGLLGALLALAYWGMASAAGGWHTSLMALVIGLLVIPGAAVWLGSPLVGRCVLHG